MSQGTSAAPEPTTAEPNATGEDDWTPPVGKDGRPLTGRETDWEMLRAEHGDLDPLELSKIAVREYAKLLRRRVYGAVIGHVRWIGTEVADPAADRSGEVAGSVPAVPREAAAESDTPSAKAAA